MDNVSSLSETLLRREMLDADYAVIAYKNKRYMERSDGAQTQIWLRAFSSTI